MKAITAKIGLGLFLSSLTIAHASAAGKVDQGSVQAALDSIRLSGNFAAGSAPLSDFYHNQSMAVQWDNAMAQRVAELAGIEVEVTTKKSRLAPYQMAKNDVQTSMYAVQIINKAKGANFPQQLATARDLQSFKLALAAGQEASFLQELRTNNVLMQQLRVAENEYRAIVAAGGWQKLKATEIAFADQKEEVAELKHRLNTENYRAGDGDRFDSQLKRALSLFQLTQNIDVTGELDKVTRSALNVPAWRRLQTVRANMARFETQKRLGTDNNIIVNIPAYSGEYFIGGEQVWTDRVIVGKTDRRTPQISSKISKVVFNPSWYVPSKLAYRDVIPRASRDPSYWRRMGYVAYDRSGQIVPVNADASMKSVFNAKNLRIKQAPGPLNALGQVKFLFPNRHAVYLHDTPSKGLFDRDTRALSSGCVRVHEPLKLAEVLFRNQIKRGHRGLEDKSIDEVIAAKKTRSVKLEDEVSVSTIYLTAEPLASGRVRFHRDVYRYDTAELASRAKGFLSQT